MKYLATLLSVVHLLTGCSSVQVGPEEYETVRISVKRMSKEKWHIHYRLPYAVEGVVFHRQTNQFRTQEWKIVNPNLEFKKIESKESVVSTNGKFSEFAVEFPPYEKTTPKDYEFFQPYSDGSVLFYTGHLYVHPLLERNGKKLSYDEKTMWTPLMTLTPFDQERIVVGGEVTNQPLDWRDDSIQGTYVYFGDLKPIVSETMIAVLDPGIPKWVTQTMTDFLPKLFDLYWEKTGQELSFKPVVYFNYKPVKMVGVSSSGGTLPGLVQLTIEGIDWEKQDKKHLEHIVWFIAHEAAHFWNGQMFRNTYDEEAWLHEGGADAFAYRSLYELGIIDKKELMAKYKNAFNLCLIGLEGDALNNSSKNRKYLNYYHCGSTIMFFVEENLDKQGKDLFGFWRELFAISANEENLYDREDFHKLLEEKYGLGKLSQLIKELELVKQKDLLSFMRRLALSAEIKVVNDPENVSSEFLYKLGAGVVAELMKQDCHGRIDVSDRGEGFLVSGGEDCKTLKKSQYDFVGLQGVPLKKNGYKPYLEAESACRKTGVVKLNYDNGEKTVSLDCNPEIFKIVIWQDLVREELLVH